MKNSKINIIFIIFLTTGLVLLFYLVYNLLTTIADYKELVKLFMVFILPLPIALFYAFINSSKPTHEKEETTKDKVFSIIILVLTCISLLFMLFWYDNLFVNKFKELRIIPIFINTMITFAYSINYMVIKNTRLSAVLSGLLLGLAIYFFIQ